MKIALIGGIYGKDKGFRQSLQMTPETILERGLRDRGHQVETLSHHQVIDGSAFDIVHVHHLGLGALRLASDSSSAAFVFTSHDPLAVMSLEPKRSRRLASHWVMSRVDAVVALSHLEAEFQRQKYSLSGAIVEVIPNGIDGGNYQYVRQNKAGKSSPWQLLFVGQLIEMKRADLLLQALALLAQPVELTLAYHNATLEASLRQLAADLGLSEQVHFLGSKNPKELAGLYQRADVFVQSSVAEALPSVVSEAMFCGTPIVATDVGGVREQLGGFGVVIPPGQVRPLAAAISRVIEHYDEFANQGEAMSREARKRFSVENMVDRHLKLYTRLIVQPGARRRHSAFRVPMNAAVNLGVSLLCATK
jgi:glycosyltransferase involved in cell wall biosynthesis